MGVCEQTRQGRSECRDRQRNDGNPGQRACAVADPGEQCGEPGHGGKRVRKAHVQTVAVEDRADNERRVPREGGAREPRRDQAGILGRRPGGRRKPPPFERRRGQVGGRD